MKHLTILPLILTLLLSTAAWSQQPSSVYEFRVLVQPGMTIGGHTFTPDTIIDSVALNDNGETAFVVHWRNRDGQTSAAVFTPERLVAHESESTGGNFIVVIPADGRLAINAAGQVAFEAIYGEEPDLAEGWDGIFVDGHLALRRSQDSEGSPFTFTDDGQVVSGLQKTSAIPAPPISPAPQGKPSLLDHLHGKIPKLPFGISISPKSTTPNQPHPAPERFTPRPPLMSTASPFPGMRTNRRGQVLIPINLSTGGFMLLLGTPSAEAPHTR